MKKSLWNRITALLLACAALFAMGGCGSKADSSDTSESSAASESTGEDIQPVTESNPDDMDYKLTYDSEAVPEGLANTISLYFYAIDTQNYDLYKAQLYTDYQESMEAYLQEKYSYGMERGLEQYHETLVNYAQTDTFTITGLEMAQAKEVLQENFEEDTDFVQDYLDTYASLLGDDFVNKMKEDATAIYDIAVTMKGNDADGNEITILDNVEVLAVEIDGTFGILG